MHRVLILVLAVTVFSGFGWGSSEDEKETGKQAEALFENSQKTAQDVSERNPRSVTTAAPPTDEDTGSITGVLATDNPTELKQRIESLARVGRALKALNENKPPTA